MFLFSETSSYYADVFLFCFFFSTKSIVTGHKCSVFLVFTFVISTVIPLTKEAASTTAQFLLEGYLRTQTWLLQHCVATRIIDFCMPSTASLYHSGV